MSFISELRENKSDSLLLGTSFKDTYSFYKELPVLGKLSDEEEKRWTIATYYFQILDTTLYLDTHDDSDAVQYLNEMKNQFLKNLTEYENLYGPVSHLSFLDYDKYLFPDTKWAF